MVIVYTNAHFTDLEINKETEIFSRSHSERAGVRILVF